jgi:hypothetical protein
MRQVRSLSRNSRKTGGIIVTAKGAATSLKVIVIICTFALITSCSGRSGSSTAQKNPPKAAPAAQAAKPQQASPSADWVVYGLDKDGTKISYDKKSIQRPTERKAVGFWLIMTPLKDSKVLTEAQERLKKEEKDYQSLATLKMLCDANCDTGNYDVSKSVMLKADGTVISEQEAAIRDNKPGPEVKTLIEKLCSGAPPGPLPKGSPQSAQGTCERAGIMVLIQPQDAVAAGAKWRVEGGEWKKSGEKLCNLPVDGKSNKGAYRIEYREIPGSPYVTPEPHNAVVSTESSYSFYNTEYPVKATGQKR